MPKVSKKVRDFFVRWGHSGGKKRAKNLSQQERSHIASHAACIRWASIKKTKKEHTSIRLKEAKLDDPVFLEEILSEGSLDSWKELYRELSDHPFGSIAEALQSVINYTHIDGVTHLWTRVLETLRGKRI